MGWFGTKSNTRSRDEIVQVCALSDMFSHWIIGNVPVEDEEVEPLLQRMKFITNLSSDQNFVALAKRVSDVVGRGVSMENCKRLVAFTRFYSAWIDQPSFRSEVPYSEEEVITSLKNMNSKGSINLSHDQARAVYAALSGSAKEGSDGTVVVKAPDYFSGVKAEMAYLSKKYGDRDVDWFQTRSSSLKPNQSGKRYEEILISLKNGDTRTVRFDITSYSQVPI
jgi:hypothetical protein